MIMMVSGRCDIVAFYSKWFINRYNEGFVDVRNPFNKSLINRIYFNDVDLYLFCTKNPLPIIDFVKTLDKPVLFHVTLTPYDKDIEPNVISKGKIIEGIKKLSNILGPDNVVVRYDPIFLSEKYNLSYHIKMFDDLCKRLDGYVRTIIVSFMDEYKNVLRNRNVLKYREFTLNDYEEIGKNFSSSAKRHNMVVQTCSEDFRLLEYGFVKGECLSKELAFKLTGKKFKKWQGRNNINCKCVEMVDIGNYNCCNHLCKYCYANYDEKNIINNIKNHDDNSSLLIGKICENSVIRVRK